MVAVLVNKNNERYYSGLEGERTAYLEMKKQGFTFVRHRYKTSHGEIDLIMENTAQSILVFVEVKRRKKIYDYHTVISSRQWKRIRDAADAFLTEKYDKYKNYSIRYDAFICFTDSSTVHHIENIFPPSS